MCLLYDGREYEGERLNTNDLGPCKPRPAQKPEDTQEYSVSQSLNKAKLEGILSMRTNILREGVKSMRPNSLQWYSATG